MHSNQTKPNQKPKSSIGVKSREKRDNKKKSFLLNKRNPTNVNVQKVKKVKKELINT